MALNPNKLNPMRMVDFLPVWSMSGVNAVSLNVDNGGAGTALGISAADADGFNLTKAGGSDRRSIGANNTALSGNLYSPATLVSLGNNNPPLVALSNSRLLGLLMNTAGDDVYHFMPIPYNWDRMNDIYVRAIWTTGSTDTADTVNWKMFFEQMILDSSRVTSTVNDTLDTAIPQDTVLGTSTNRIHRSPNGIIRANTLTPTAEYLHCIFEMDAKAVGLTEDIFLIGMEFEYTERKGRGFKTSIGQQWKAPY